MTTYKVLGGDWGEGYKAGDTLEAEPHAMEARLAKGEVEEVVKKKKVIKK